MLPIVELRLPLNPPISSPVDDNKISPRGTPKVAAISTVPIAVEVIVPIDFSTVPSISKVAAEGSRKLPILVFKLPLSPVATSPADDKVTVPIVADNVP